MIIKEERERLVGKLYDYIHEIVDISLQNHWKIIIWGFGRGGNFLKYLIEEVDARTKVSYIIDQKIDSRYYSKPVIFRSTFLNYIDSSEYMILSSIRNISEIRMVLEKSGYIAGKNYFDTYTDIGDSYIRFLQKNNKVNFDSTTKEEMEENRGREYNEHEPFRYVCDDKIFDIIADLDGKISLFDYGCGKGAAILMAYMSGIKKIGGVEIEKGIYAQAIANMKELNIDCEIINDDAVNCKIDGYNCFFLYNPFTGTVFRKVIESIEESYRKDRRKIYIVYANPFCHKEVIADGIFRLYKQIYTDCYDPLLNIYESEI